MLPPRQYPQPIGSFHRPMVRRVAQHEVGHYAVAKVLGFGTGSIDLTIFDLNGGHQAGSEIYPSCALRDMQGIDDYLERRITVLYAGALAETLNKGTLNNDDAIKSLRAGGGVRDFDKARELIQLLRSIRFPDSANDDQINIELNDIDNKLWNRAAEIVQAECEIIEGIAGC